MSDFTVPVGDPLPYERHRENFLIEGDVVYKIYDFRDTVGQGERRLGENVTFLGAEQVLQDDAKIEGLDTNCLPLHS